MKTDFSAIREELQKLTDVEYLKKELNRAANEIRNFDVKKIKLTPEAKAKLKLLEKRFNEVVDRVRVLEKQVDTEVNKLVVIMKKTRNEAEAKLREFASGAKRSSSKSSGSKKKSSKKKTTTKARRKKSS